ncbi:hypothetical protein TNCV_1918991 [Trichonephila clavipes]|nr:hypothetical protein TNCV_1918991 [Trichonephila clavipes]
MRTSHSAVELAVNLHFACQESGGRTERNTNVKLANIHLTYGTADPIVWAAHRLVLKQIGWLKLAPTADTS